MIVELCLVRVSQTARGAFFLRKIAFWELNNGQRTQDRELFLKIARVEEVR